MPAARPPRWSVTCRHTTLADAAVAMDQTLYPPELVSRLFDQVDRLPQVSVAAHVQGVFLEVMDANGQFVPAFDFGSAARQARRRTGDPRGRRLPIVQRPLSGSRTGPMR